jgi:hypothetical protein
MIGKVNYRVGFLLCSKYSAEFKVWRLFFGYVRLTQPMANKIKVKCDKDSKKGENPWLHTCLRI